MEGDGREAWVWEESGTEGRGRGQEGSVVESKKSLK